MPELNSLVSDGEVLGVAGGVPESVDVDAKISAATGVVAGDLDGHEAATTGVHGIPDTSLLLTDADIGGSVQGTDRVLLVPGGGLAPRGGATLTAMGANGVPVLRCSGGINTGATALIPSPPWTACDAWIWWAPTTTDPGAIRLRVGLEGVDVGSVPTSTLSHRVQTPASPGVASQVVRTQMGATQDLAGAPPWRRLWVDRQGAHGDDTIAAAIDILAVELVRA